MVSIRLFKILVFFAVTSLVAGCKLTVIVPPGGDVISRSGTRNCAEGSLCEFNVTDNTFSESFTAVAQPGYVFTKWSNSNGFLCADSVHPTCMLHTKGIPQGNAAVDSALKGGLVLYAMPLFEVIGVTTNGAASQNHLDAEGVGDDSSDFEDNKPVPKLKWAGVNCRGAAKGKVLPRGNLFTSLWCSGMGRKQPNLREENLIGQNVN